MIKLLSFVGTRPEIVKTLAFVRAAPRIPGVEFKVFFTAQNFGREMSECFWEELNIPIERVNPGVDRASSGSIARSLMDFAVSSIREYKPDVVVSNTDTDTAFYSALGAAKSGVRVAHIEGGIRCEARTNPEEINRRLADHLSDWIFAISEEDMASLRQEGFGPEQAFMLGDITWDALNMVLQEHRIRVARGDYDLLTVHRQENVGNAKRLGAILRGVRAAGQRTVFPVHPRTRQALETPEISDILRSAKNIELLLPQSYLAMVRLLAGCRKVISDSGGLRREGYLCGKPVISLIWFVWFKGMNRLGFERVVEADDAAVAREIRTFDPPGPRPPLFGDGRSGESILRKIVHLAGAGGR